MHLKSILKKVLKNFLTSIFPIKIIVKSCAVFETICKARITPSKLKYIRAPLMLCSALAAPRKTLLTSKKYYQFCTLLKNSKQSNVNDINVFLCPVKTIIKRV